MMKVYLDHRLEVTLRRTTYDRDKAADRLHLVEGLLLAILDIDDVIAIIRSSDDAAAARARLIEAFELDEVQAGYILDMQLRRLTRYSSIELETEQDELRGRIAALSEIIEHEDQLRRLVGNELAEIAKQHGTPASDHPARRLRRHGGRGAAGGDRRPVLGAALLRRSARPNRPRRGIGRCHPHRRRIGPDQP